MKIIDTNELLHREPESDLLVFGRKYGLTPTEIDILSYLLEAFSLKRIAAETNRTYGTVRWHIRNLLEKCQVSSQSNLLREFYALIKN